MDPLYSHLLDPSASHVVTADTNAMRRLRRSEAPERSRCNAVQGRGITPPLPHTEGPQSQNHADLGAFVMPGTPFHSVLQFFVSPVGIDENR